MSIQSHDLSVIHGFLTTNPALFFGFHFISDTSYEPLWDTPHEVYKQSFFTPQFPYHFLSFSFCHWAWRWELIFTIHLELPWKHYSGCVYEAESRKKCKQGGRIHLEYGQYHPRGQPLAEKKKMNGAPAFISLWFLTADLTVPLPTVHSTSCPGRLYSSLNCKSKQTPSSLRCFLSGRGNEKGNSLAVPRGIPASICYGLHLQA